MFNPKLSGVFAGLGFVLSFLVGLVAGANFPLILIRAFVFAAIFFALSSAGYGAIQMFLPELLSKTPANAPVLGGQVDISIGGDDEGPSGISLESGSLGEDLHDFLENPGNSSGDTLDQSGEAVYTGEGAVEEIPHSPAPALPEETGLSSGDSVDMLPDLDAMSGAFSASPVPPGGEAAGAPSPPGSFGGVGAPGGRAGKQGLDENFNVKEMASAIQTILKRENKG
jgi:hypothetical protein